MPGQPRNLFHGHALVTHHADERDPCRRSVSRSIARCLLDGKNRTLRYAHCGSVSSDDGSPLGSHGTIGNGCPQRPDRSRLTAPDDRHGGGMAATCAVIVAGWTELEPDPTD